MLRDSIIIIFNFFSNKKQYNKFFVELHNNHSVNYFPEEDRLSINKPNKNGRFRSYAVISETALKSVLADMLITAFLTEELSFCEKLTLLNQLAPINKEDS